MPQTNHNIITGGIRFLETIPSEIPFEENLHRTDMTPETIFFDKSFLMDFEKPLSEQAKELFRMLVTDLPEECFFSSGKLNPKKLHVTLRRRSPEWKNRGKLEDALNEIKLMLLFRMRA
jgi:hypothetical protein